MVYATVESPYTPYRVAYNSNEAGFSRPYVWCLGNCRGAFEATPGWASKGFFNFEEKEDAVLFALKFGNVHT